MSGKHRQHADDQLRSSAGPVARRNDARRSKTASVLTSTSVALAVAGFTTAVFVATAHHGDTPQPQTVQPAPVAAEVQTPRPLQQHGVIVAVTPDSITARSADGSVRTYRVTPNTTAVTLDGGNSFATNTPFAVDDEVAIQATVTAGTATATAVADRAVIGGYGPPMDSM
ncbi:hypothetical protein BH11ACT7_BH11ACT7_34920 [soil metagenome]